MIALTSSKCINTKQSLFTLESTFLHTHQIASLDMDASNRAIGFMEKMEFALTTNIFILS